MVNLSVVDDTEVQAFYETVSSNVKKLRKEKGITQLEMALMLGQNSPSFYTMAENNKSGKHFNVEHLFKIARVLDVEFCDLFN